MNTRMKTVRRVAPWAMVPVLLLHALPAAGQDAPADTAASANFPPHPNPTGREITPRQDQTPEQQWSDKWDCYDEACAQADWDPYRAYDELVAQGYAVALDRQDMEDEMVRRAMEGAETGAVAGSIAGRPGRGAELGAAIAIALEVMRSGYLEQEDDPEARRAVSRFERELRDWDRRFAACLRPRGYSVTSP